MLDRLESETGIDPGWSMVGGLFLASTKERLDEYKRLHTIGKAFGIESHVLGPEESQKIYPLLDIKTVYGTLYSPADGHVEPNGLCQALTKFATRKGAKVIENCEVQEIKTENSILGSQTVKGVKTNRGYIETSVVVNCSGAWSPSVCSMVGLSIPLIPMKHSYVVFDTIEGAKGLPNMRDHDGSVYFRVHGDTLAIGGYEPDPIILDKVENDFSFGLYDLDWDVFGKHIDLASTRIPKLKDVGIKSTICGPESFTPDHKPIMGEDPSIRGFYHGCGFNSAGMMMGGGCGNQLAKWIYSGQPDLDMFGYDVKRFSPKLLPNKLWAKERSHEAYAQNYNIVYKNDEKLAGRNQFLGPLHATLTEQGCFYQERQGWERPGYFVESPCPVQPYDYYGQYGHTRNSDITYKETLAGEYSFGFSKHQEIIRQEALNCRKKCAIFDMSYFGKFFLVGPDATKAAQYIFSNDMNKPPGSGLGYYLAVGGTTSAYTYSTIMSIIRSKNFKVDLVDQSDHYGMMSVQGPNSRAILTSVFNDTIYFDNESFPFSTHKICTLDGINVRLMRVSFVGELGWELHVPNDKCFKIYHHICEVGYRHWHADIRSDDSPLEAGLGFTCKLKSNEDFHGRDALVKYKNSGSLKKRLFCFTIDYKDSPLWGLETIWNDTTNKPVGYLRRADYAFTLDNGIGYGYLYEDLMGQKLTNAKNIANNNSFSIEIMGQRLPAQIHLKSPFDPMSLRVQGVYSQV
ncbi:Sarcosine dehydrogenase, mitochondrial [Folsomia candida]|uniref:Sarcosine dehydrogenase, mitochondrial n=1 Tax=Folsomia candida TaxID=158441 RepID=A0A226DM24_FOLCA|nr:Sarcosine dehydrogenase, mitochondrial [Folsomia candida]